MFDLLEAIMNHFSGSDLAEDVGDRLFYKKAPQGAEFPHVVFSRVSKNPDKTFSEDYWDWMYQFDIYSASDGATEITNIEKHLEELFDEQDFTISGSTLIWMKLVNSLDMPDEDVVTTTGEKNVQRITMDFDIKTLTT